MSAAINQAELTQRVAILRRFKDLLEQQRERFRNYLALLENQETVIGSGSGEEILAHVELEERIVADIFSMQKVINPLEDMYRAVAPHSLADDEIPALKTALDDMKIRVQAQSAKNRGLLSARMAEIRTEMDTLKDNPFLKSARGSAYGNAVTASLIDVQG
ncbi:MAG: flagellar biosynthesis protein FlgN [Treponema sp.]|nr:flagellar biosynthesis protein FlgN [Treponema sp.]MCL2190755.1 flagellar biosynthesis protein FlgN [Treponema sp.]